jgi:hypothetical protein
MTNIERGLQLRKKVKELGKKFDVDFIGLKDAVQRLPAEARIDLGFIVDELMSLKGV